MVCVHVCVRLHMGVGMLANVRKRALICQMIIHQKSGRMLISTQAQYLLISDTSIGYNQISYPGLTSCMQV